MLASTVACILAAAGVDHVPPMLIASVLAVEGGQVGTASKNADGSVDLGPGQINSFWLHEVGKAANRTPEQAEALLRYDGCFNIRVTSRILRYEINRAGQDVWAGVAHYHSPLPLEGAGYVRLVKRSGESLFGRRFLVVEALERKDEATRSATTGKG